MPANIVNPISRWKWPRISPNSIATNAKKPFTRFILGEAHMEPKYINGNAKYAHAVTKTPNKIAASAQKPGAYLAG